ncbi:MAG: ribonuclease HII [Bacteroidetes bacterium]|nr:ribonuclease HII [Bacteroidota bacterium]
MISDNSRSIISQRKILPMIEYESKFWENGLRFIAGVDESGRGPLAGPVVAAAVVFPKSLFARDSNLIADVKDSKKLTHKKRVQVFENIQKKALSIGVGIVSHNVIDEVNILNATFRAMHKAINRLVPPPDHLLIDGPHFAEMDIPCTKIIDGDSKSFTIAAASIIAKVVRDNLMAEYDEKYPEYGFSKHKGYGTSAHIAAIKKFGYCEIHRRSFKFKRN